MSNTNNRQKALRFAPLIRVSTDRQATKGESLRTQRSQIEQAVKTLGGIIPPECWAYSGQEHATPDQERHLLEKLLDDAVRGLFDAVIVCDASRWSRDNLQSKKGLEILRDNNIKFFIGVTEYYLNRPDHLLYLGMSAEIGEFHAAEQNRKSILNRIERAKRNIPTCGKLPYGRTFDEKNGWGIDKDKAAQIQWAAKKYLDGGNLIKIAKTLNMNAANLWKVLTRRSGDSWSIRFRNGKLKIDETVRLEIPSLLPPDTIRQILGKAAANKTYTHGHLKNRYLLSRMVFCAECGYAMFGQTNHGIRRYYRHARNRVRTCDKSIWVPAKELEHAVLVNLFSMFGDKKAIERSIEAAFPKSSEVPKIESNLACLEKELGRVEKNIDRLASSIANGTITEDEARKTISKYRERQSALRGEIEALNSKLREIPAKRDIQERAQRMYEAARLRALEHEYKSIDYFPNMPYENKRGLVEDAFAGPDRHGQRLGVYVRKAARTGAHWSYTIRGILPEEFFGSVKDELPMSKEREDILLGKFDPETDLLPEDFKAHETKYTLSLRAQGLL